ncbi:MAG: oligosaccharide flippase family protein [Chloroflexota bacterium]
MLARLSAIPERLLRRGFAREVFILQVGSFATMGVQFASSVVMANVLGAGNYGTYLAARNVLDLVTMFANLAVGQALITKLAAAYARRDEKESINLLAYFLKLGLTVGLIELAIGLLGGNYLCALFRIEPEIANLARILFLIPPFTVILNMAVLALQSSRQIARLTLLENGALMFTSLLNAGVVALGGGVHGLLYTSALAPIFASVGALLLYRATLSRMPGFPTLTQIVRAVPSVSYGRYFAFSALVSVDKNLANLLALAPTTLLAFLSNKSELAYFRVGFNLMNFLSVPVAPIARNLYAVLSETLAKRGARQMGRTLLKATLLAGAISVASTVVMLLASPLILTIYRPEYGAAQAVMYALGLRFVLLGFGVGLGPIYQVLNAMKLAIATKAIPGLIMFGGGWLMIGQYGAVGAALTIVGAYAVGDITNALLVPWMVRRAARAESVAVGSAGSEGSS